MTEIKANSRQGGYLGGDDVTKATVKKMLSVSEIMTSQPYTLGPDDSLAKARELKPDLILMDINMPHCSGLEAVSAIRRELPGVKIIMLTVHDEDENLFEAIKRGAEGFLSKNVRARDLLNSLRGVMRGEAASPSLVIAQLESQQKGRFVPGPRMWYT